MVFKRLDRAYAEHREKVERHVRGAEVFEHIASEREGQALPAEFRGRCNRIPALLDIVPVGFGEAIR